MAHNHHAALELVDGLAQRVDRLDIATIKQKSFSYRWLVGSSKSRMCGWLSEISAKVTSIAEAQTLAAARLRLHNKYAKTATFTLPGRPQLMAGVTVALEGWGAWDGKYLITQAKHTVGGSGYSVQVKLRKVLEGY